MIEQLPSPTNRVVLDTKEQDLYGVPLPRIHYDIGDYARNGLAAARGVHNEVFGKLARHGHTAQGRTSKVRSTSSAPAAMGLDPAQSVVDGRLRSHDHANLYLTGLSRVSHLRHRQPPPSPSPP